MLISPQQISPPGFRNKQAEEIGWGDGWWLVLEGVAVKVADPWKPNYLKKCQRQVSLYVYKSRSFLYCYVTTIKEASDI